MPYNFDDTSWIGSDGLVFGAADDCLQPSGGETARVAGTPSEAAGEAGLEAAAATPLRLIDGSGASEDIRGTSGDDDIFARGGADRVRGRDGADVLDGGKGRDLIYGGDGRDAIWGGQGLDTIYGGDGRDDFWFDERDEYDRIRDFREGDTLVIDAERGDFEGARRRDVDIDRHSDHDRIYVYDNLVARVFGEVVIQDDILLWT